MATIEKTGSGYRVRQHLDGKLKTIARAGTKVEAVRIQARLEEDERARSMIVYGTHLPMGEVLARWKADRIGAGNDPLHTEVAVARMRSLCDARGWHGTASVTALAASTFRQQGGSPRAGALIAGVLRWARDILDQRVDPKALVVLRPGKPGRKPSPTLMSDEQVQAAEALAARMSPSAAALVHCLSTYGWRPITAARLTVADLDVSAGTITCQVKGGDEVRHPLHADTLDRIVAVALGREPEAPLFLDPRHATGWAVRGSRTIDQWARDHLRIKVYDLKRYAISTMLDKGISPQDIASFTGHRTISQVLKYARTNEARQRATLAKLAGKKLEGPANPTPPEAGADSHKRLIFQRPAPSPN